MIISNQNLGHGACQATSKNLSSCERGKARKEIWVCWGCCGKRPVWEIFLVLNYSGVLVQLWGDVWRREDLVMNMHHLKHTHLYWGMGLQQLETCCLMGSKEEASQVAKRMSALLMLPVQAGAALQKTALCCGDNTVKKPWIRHCRAMLVFFHM